MLVFQFPKEFIESFKRDYYKQGKYKLEVQVPHLARLAEHYREKYQQTQQWTDCLKVSKTPKIGAELLIYILLRGVSNPQEGGQEPLYDFLTLVNNAGAIFLIIYWIETFCCRHIPFSTRLQQGNHKMKHGWSMHSKCNKIIGAQNQKSLVSNRKSSLQGSKWS